MTTCRNLIVVTSAFTLFDENKLFDEFYAMVGFVRSATLDFDFDKLYPTPEDVEDQYDWKRSYWGSSSNAEEPTVSYYFENDFCEINFLSQETPPIRLIYSLSLRFPNLEFEHIFEHSEDNYSGVRIYVNGEQTLSKDGNFGDILIFEDDYCDFSLVS